MHVGRWRETAGDGGRSHLSEGRAAALDWRPVVYVHRRGADERQVRPLQKQRADLTVLGGGSEVERRLASGGLRLVVDGWG